LGLASNLIDALHAVRAPTVEEETLRDLTQEHVAERVGLTCTSITNIECGRCDTKTETHALWREVFGSYFTVDAEPAAA
jgi:DNA-binding XRE family transcriptional regulator